MTIIIPTLAAFTAPGPDITDPSTFESRAQTLLGELQSFPGAMNAVVDAINTQVNDEVANPWRVRAVTGADTVVAGDRKRILDLSGTFTLAATACATLGDGFWWMGRVTGSGVVTFDPAASELVDGQASGKLYPGTVTLFVIEAGAWKAYKMSGIVRLTLTSGSSWLNDVLGSSRARYRLVGGGGGGGRSASASRAMAGTAGASAEGELVTGLGTAHAIAIGAAGPAAASDGTAGGGGGTTTLYNGLATITAPGGPGGGGSTSTGISAPAALATNGDINSGGAPGRLGLEGGSVGGSGPLGIGGVIAASGTLAPGGWGAGGAGNLAGAAAQSGTQGAIILEVL